MEEAQDVAPSSPLLLIPFTPLLRLLQFLPHSSLLPLAASCSFLHSTIHSSPFLWSHLTLDPSMVATSPLSLIAMLREKGEHVRRVKIKFCGDPDMLNNIIIAFLVSFCAKLEHLAFSYLHSPHQSNPLQLLANSCPQLTSLKIKAFADHEGLEQISKLSNLICLFLFIKNDERSQSKIAEVFQKSPQPEKGDTRGVKLRRQSASK